MKTIKPGTVPVRKHPLVGMNSQCSNCGCVVQFEAADLLRSDLEQLAERCIDGKTTFSLVCPTEGCGQRVEWVIKHDNPGWR